MLLQPAKSIGLEVSSPPSPERSRLDDCYLSSRCDSQPCSALVPFFPEVHEELTKMWKAAYAARSHLSSSLLTILDGVAARECVDVPQVERVVVVLLCYYFQSSQCCGVGCLCSARLAG